MMGVLLILIATAAGNPGEVHIIGWGENFPTEPLIQPLPPRDDPWEKWQKLHNSGIPGAVFPDQQIFHNGCRTWPSIGRLTPTISFSCGKRAGRHIPGIPGLRRCIRRKAR